MRQPPEKLDTGSSWRAVGEAEARQQRAGARAGAVTARDFEAMVQLREPLAARVRIGGVLRRRQRDVALDRAQFDVAVEHVLDRRQRRRRGLLRHVRHDPRRRHRGIASVGDKLAAQQREQAGLAAAVGADDADFLPRMHRQRRAFEQPSRAAGKGQIGDSNHRDCAEEGKAFEEPDAGASREGPECTT